MEKQVRKAHELWLTCQTLQAAIHEQPDGGDSLKPLAPELAAISEAAGVDNVLVAAVVAAVPEMALSRGVWSKQTLAGRFAHVRRVCRRVAMIDETGGTLARFFLSYVQSLFVITSARTFGPEDEIDPAALDTFAVIDNASRALDAGDLERAVRFVGLLTGEAQRVAADWLCEARLTLEASQAADALLSHASAAGLAALG